MTYEFLSDLLNRYALASTKCNCMYCAFCTVSEQVGNLYSALAVKTANALSVLVWREVEMFELVTKVRQRQWLFSWLPAIAGLPCAAYRWDLTGSWRAINIIGWGMSDSCYSTTVFFLLPLWDRPPVTYWDRPNVLHNKLVLGRFVYHGKFL